MFTGVLKLIELVCPDEKGSLHPSENMGHLPSGDQENCLCQQQGKDQYC